MNSPLRTFWSRTVLLLACGLLVAASWTVEQAAAKTHVERVSFTARSDGKGYVVRFHVDGPIAAYSEPRIAGGDRLEMLLFNTGLSASFERDEPRGPVSSYSQRLASGHLAFTFQLDPANPVSASAYRDRESNDVLIGLTFVDGAIAGARDAPGRLPVPVRKASTLPPSSGTPESNVSAANPASAEARRWMLDTIVIDAGHGGRDPGALDNGVREKDITLGVALKLGAYLRDLLGVNVVYTRRDDRFIELKDRGKIANENGGKLFISIHVNAAASPAAVGSETYFLGMHKNDAARKTMERENAVVKFESSQSEYESMTEEALIRMELTHSAYMRKSQELSGLIQEQFEDRVSRNNRGVKQAGFYVLWGASMPAVLVELGFITNRREAAFLQSDKGQDYMASAIYRAVKAYKEQYEKGLSRVSSE